MILNFLKNNQIVGDSFFSSIGGDFVTFLKFEPPPIHFLSLFFSIPCCSLYSNVVLCVLFIFSIGKRMEDPSMA